ncbi:polyprenol monophosphomannose synthase [Runella slithyformis]|uniref:Dolichyl-phosphate beta-D-mannosyltransferase n=1 Tax=Runella slithyformis (strain ATCC 29530 / DSM 19594 / LMG 11500 / NCIMB 11436 / LSU 4) TaxID=761193 RepID=A0A7U4E567_RUNSL|nr:polyprenol monophosphomannose synthase [Runella slithyformis]AEI47878.1 Dolichyl-phosphate beta-D-mannosyltransferase [Runella slithyformis DSM 19594]
MGTFKENLVVIPTYNEIENIEAIIRKVFSLAHPFDVLVVDDGSPDGTALKVRELQSEYPERLHLLERKGKQGLGTAYIHGFQWAFGEGYRYLFEMDADFSHNPDDLLRLYNACAKEGNDVAIGSRYIKGVNVVNWPMGRVLMSYFAGVYVRFVTGMQIMDPTAGFICYKREVLQGIGLNDIRFVGYAFQIEMKFNTWKYGYSMTEVPIIFTDRTKGVSKMSTKIFKEAVLGVLYLKIRSFFKTYIRKTDAKPMSIVAMAEVA